MKFVNMPLAYHHKAYKPLCTPAMDIVESQLIVMACSRFEKSEVLEIGTQYGDTTTNMARVVKLLGGKIVTVDVKSSPATIPYIQRDDCRPEAEIGRNIPDELRGCITQVLIDPNDPNSLSVALDKFDGRMWDVVFIDGDHSYEGVKHDYISVMQRVSERGIILFHDVWWDVEPPPVDGPLRLMRELEGCVLNLTHLGCLGNHLGRFFYP